MDSAIWSLLAFLSELIGILILVRVLLTYFPSLNHGHPLVRILQQIVDPILAPFRHLLPRFGMIDLSPILAMITFYELSNVFSTLAAGGNISVPLLIISIISQIVRALILIVAIIVLLQVLMSVFNADPWHPITMTVRELSRPLIAPFRGLFHRTSSGVDGAAILAFIAYVVLYIVAGQLFIVLANLFVPAAIVVTPN
jgi:YggT family protein